MPSLCISCKTKESDRITLGHTVWNLKPQSDKEHSKGMFLWASLHFNKRPQGGIQVT